MIFIETSVFTSAITDVMSDEIYRELQEFLARHPEGGDIIKGAGGLRKIRWKVPGSGKRGGVRAIYYYRTAEDHILMLYVFKKGDASDLTEAQKKLLRKMVENW